MTAKASHKNGCAKRYGRYECKKCTFNEFEIYLNVYSELIILEPHFEIVCARCGYGQVVLGDNFKEKQNDLE